MQRIITLEETDHARAAKTNKGDEMIKYSERMTVERDGYNDMYGAPVQGALQCRVSCPVDKQALALDLATLMADGYTRHAAAAYMARSGYDVRGIRILSASRIN